MQRQHNADCRQAAKTKSPTAIPVTHKGVHHKRSFPEVCPRRLSTIQIRQWCISTFANVTWRFSQPHWLNTVTKQCSPPIRRLPFSTAHGAPKIQAAILLQPQWSPAEWLRSTHRSRPETIEPSSASKKTISSVAQYV